METHVRSMEKKHVQKLENQTIDNMNIIVDAMIDCIEELRQEVENLTTSRKLKKDKK
jgi:hypothetical protein